MRLGSASTRTARADGTSRLGSYASYGAKPPRIYRSLFSDLHEGEMKALVQAAPPDPPGASAGIAELPARCGVYDGTPGLYWRALVIHIL